MTIAPTPPAWREPSITVNVHLEVDTRLDVHAQRDPEDGRYRCSIITLGEIVRRLDIFAEPDQLQRLRDAIDAHLSALEAAYDA